MKNVPLVAVRSISKSWKNIDALIDFSIDIDRGTSFSLLGPNGAGKTTLMKIILGLITPDSGDITISGTSALSATSRIGVRYLPENITFPKWITPLKLFKQIERIRKETSHTDFLSRIDELQCSPLLDRPFGKMSRGQRQRVALALMTAGSPSFLLLDEPSSGLDPAGRVLVRNLIRQLMRNGSTVMINSHLLGEVERVCDRAAFISNGRLIAEGDLDELAQEKGLVLVETPEPELMKQTLAFHGTTCRIDDRGVLAEIPDPSLFRELTTRIIDTAVPFTGIKLLKEDLEEIFLRIMDNDSRLDGR